MEKSHLKNKKLKQLNKLKYLKIGLKYDLL